MNLRQFLNSGYTAYHVTRNCKTMLDEAGFCRLTFGNWNIVRGGKYYIINNDSSIVAFAIGETDNLVMSLAHTDSPSLSIKGDSLVSGNGVTRANVEVYGGLLRYSYLDRQLKIAGRVIVDQDNGLVTRLVESDYNVVIPSVAIHHNPTANDSLCINAQTDMLPIVGLESGSIYASLCADKVVDADLYIVPCAEAFVAGVDNKLLCSARLDNLVSVYCSLSALIDSKPQSIAVCCCFDSEEIGSNTKQGAMSTWLSDIISHIGNSLEWTRDKVSEVVSSAFALSIDNAHAVHPAHPEKYDITQRAHMGGGVVVKHNTRYATDAMSSSVLKKCLATCGIPCQDYYNRSDMPNGGTLGLIVSGALNINVVDIGIAQLAMHSACETICIDDVQYMSDAIKCIFEKIIIIDMGQATIQ